MLNSKHYHHTPNGIEKSLEFIVENLYEGKAVYFIKIESQDSIKVIAFKNNEEEIQKFKNLMKKVDENEMVYLKQATKDELFSEYGKDLTLKVFGKIALDISKIASSTASSTVNPVYKKQGYKKIDDLLELYKINNSEDAQLYIGDRYGELKLVYETILRNGPIFLIKYNNKDVVSLGPDLNITVGKKEVKRTFKDSEEEKTILIPYTMKDVAPFLNHIDRNYKEDTFQSYMKELKEDRDDLFRFSSSWGKGREGLDASPGVELAVEKVPPVITKELQETEKKLNKLKELISLMNQDGEQNKEKIQQLTRDIDFDIDTGTFVRTAPMKAGAEEEAAFIRTAPEESAKFLRLAPKECVNCGCTEEECAEGCECKEGKCNCSSCCK